MQSMKKIVASLTVAALCIGASLGLTGTAFADPPEGGSTSCMAYEASDVSPPGSTTGATNQFGMSGVMNLGIQGAVDGGLFSNRGAFVKALAHAELGSHEACDEAFGLNPETE
jgi:hypothetical protein